MIQRWHTASKKFSTPCKAKAAGPASLQWLRDLLEHHFSDESCALGKPTLDYLCPRCIATALSDRQPTTSHVCVWHDRIGDGCVLDLP